MLTVAASNPELLEHPLAEPEQFSGVPVLLLQLGEGLTQQRPGHVHAGRDDLRLEFHLAERAPGEEAHHLGVQQVVAHLVPRNTAPRNLTITVTFFRLSLPPLLKAYLAANSALALNLVFPSNDP